MPYFSAAKRRWRAPWSGWGGVVASRFILGTSRRLSLPRSHAQFVDFALMAPFFSFLAEAVAHGVVAHIVPFLVVAFVSAEATVPEFFLPEGFWSFMGGFPFAGDRVFPEGDPAFERDITAYNRRAKEMQVVRQNHISADKPA